MQGVPGTSRRSSKSLIVVASCPSMWIMDVSYFVISGTRVCSHWAAPHDTLSPPPRLLVRLALVPCGNYRQQVRGHSLVLALLVQHPEADQGPLQGGDPGGYLHQIDNGTKLSLASYLIIHLHLHLVSGGVGHLRGGAGDLLVPGVYLQDLAHSSQVTCGHDGDLMEHLLGVSSPLITPLLTEMSERRLQSLNGGSC